MNHHDLTCKHDDTHHIVVTDNEAYCQDCFVEGPSPAPRSPQTAMGWGPSYYRTIAAIQKDLNFPY